ncbi:FAD-dependent monooxygenase [Ammoniphilus resinae]|uniref:2-polyprenyl-6-methoxyphenol hydroxylase-like FAD-dependent oxidoreductase n=1 Tax=Ammoniphilus resinae TaxID=861532 RepID=A0ABS4GS77_9BACL|nr:2-polyprenyl-6-methoxyphenol hydroxylase-like FAD-dependent oxidoreductase [Ammoniphilus resinae]
MDLHTDVCIVGAGPAGALLGFILASRGISTILIERYGGVEKQFRGEHLNSDAVQVLKKYKLFEKIKERGILAMKRVEYFYQHGRIKTIPLDEEEGDVSIHFPHGNLLHVLIEESKKYENYKILMNTRLTDLIKNGYGKYIGVKAKRDEEVITIHCRCVIGADGRYSTIRKLADIPTEIIKHGYDVLWAKIPAPVGWEPTIRLALVHHKQLALFTQTGGFVQIGWNIEEGAYFHLVKQPFEPFIEQLLDAFPELIETVRQNIQSWRDFVNLRVQSCRCSTWVKEGLVILGDAAHTMSPTGAIGVSAALKDADTLGEILSEACLDNDFSYMRLKEFEHRRREEIEKLQAEQFEEETAYEGNFHVFS